MSEKIRKLMQKDFANTRTISVTGVEKPSRTWGYIIHGQYNGCKFTSISGYGCCKRTALIQETLRIIGNPKSLRGYDSAKFDDIEVVLEYNGTHEIQWTITKH